MDGGFEYKVAEVGRGWSRALQPAAYELADSHAHFNRLNMNQNGVMA